MAKTKTSKFLSNTLRGISLFIGLLITIGVSAQNKNLLSPQQFQKQVIGPKVQLLDVRTANEYKQSHLLNSLQADWYNQTEFAKKIKSLNKDQPLYIYCRTGIRSNEARKYLTENGFTKVFELNGGIENWIANYFPVVK